VKNNLLIFIILINLITISNCFSDDQDCIDCLDDALYADDFPYLDELKTSSGLKEDEVFYILADMSPSLALLGAGSFNYGAPRSNKACDQMIRIYDVIDYLNDDQETLKEMLNVLQDSIKSHPEQKDEICSNHYSLLNMIETLNDSEKIPEKRFLAYKELLSEKYSSQNIIIHDCNNQLKIDLKNGCELLQLQQYILEQYNKARRYKNKDVDHISMTTNGSCTIQMMININNNHKSLIIENDEGKKSYNSNQIELILNKK